MHRYKKLTPAQRRKFNAKLKKLNAEPKKRPFKQKLAFAYARK